MTTDVDLPTMYRGKVNLWVEDAITRIYLKECWGADPDIFFLTAGGNENLGALVEDARSRGYQTVFGFSDRDFRNSNRANWNSSANHIRCFVPDTHELENYLLDERSLAGCVLNTGRRTAGEIKARLRSRASDLMWWMACRLVIVGLRREFREEFLIHPKCPTVTDKTSAEQCIVNQNWFSQLKSRSDKATAAGEISTRLDDAYRVVQQQMNDGSWRTEFSGKELFRDLRGWLHTSPPKPASSSELDIDVARAVAQCQVGNGAVPAEVQELRRAVRQKAGLP